MQNNIFNRTFIALNMNRLFGLFLVFIFFTSCVQEEVVTFTSVSKIHEENASIEINIPVAQGETALSKSINKTINDHIANMLNFSEEPVNNLDLDQAIEQFDQEYSSFKSDIAESALVWEAIFDSEVIYQSSEVICIALNGYMNTGGAHGNMNITLYNFDGETGELLEPKDLVSDLDKFTEFVKPYFIQAIAQKDDEGIEEYFFGDPFHLPANIGINDDGLLILYNVYEIGSYAQGITEFTIPFEDVQAFLQYQ
ncbi:MAG: DUF3298 and DUF4163 domain-containing protein [Bacteroidia bacterium]|nr:DUF3298 and DUF4163 domain-containing protein [Bacteroidia bacterium]